MGDQPNVSVEVVKTTPGPVEVPQPADVVVAESSSIEEVAKEAIAGHWGRGNTRKKRLRDAGFDPDQVQEEVDKIFNRK